MPQSQIKLLGITRKRESEFGVHVDGQTDVDGLSTIGMTSIWNRMHLIRDSNDFGEYQQSDLIENINFEYSAHRGIHSDQRKYVRSSHVCMMSNVTICYSIVSFVCVLTKKTGDRVEGA